MHTMKVCAALLLAAVPAIYAQSNPSINTEDGNLDILTEDGTVRVKREGGMRISRQVTVDVIDEIRDLQDRVTTAENSAQLIASREAFNATLAATAMLTNQIIQVQNGISSVGADATTAVNNGITSIRTEINGNLTDIRDETNTAINNINTRVNDSLGKVRLDVTVCNTGANGTLRLNNGAVQVCNGAEWSEISSSASVKTIYTNWGTNTCKGQQTHGVRQLFNGFAWAGHHDHRGGGTPLCLKSGGGNNGGRVDGDDTMNLLYPLGLQGPAMGAGNIQSGRLIRCAQCEIQKSCFVQTGQTSCPTGYSAVYEGATAGGIHGQISQNERICLDRQGLYDRGETPGAYVYPSKVRYDWDGRQNNAILLCQYCCADE